MAIPWSMAVDMWPSCWVVPSGPPSRVWACEAVVVLGMRWVWLRLVMVFEGDPRHPAMTGSGDVRDIEGRRPATWAMADPDHLVGLSHRKMRQPEPTGPVACVDASPVRPEGQRVEGTHKVLALHSPPDPQMRAKMRTVRRHRPYISTVGAIQHNLLPDEHPRQHPPRAELVGERDDEPSVRVRQGCHRLLPAPIGVGRCLESSSSLGSGATSHHLLPSRHPAPTGHCGRVAVAVREARLALSRPAARSCLVLWSPAGAHGVRVGICWAGVRRAYKDGRGIIDSGWFPIRR